MSAPRPNARARAGAQEAQAQVHKAAWCAPFPRVGRDGGTLQVGLASPHGDELRRRARHAEHWLRSKSGSGGGGDSGERGAEAKAEIV